MTQPTQPPPIEAAMPAKARPKAPIVVAIVIAVAVVAAGVVAAVTLLRGSTPTAASKGLPSDVLASMEVNLNPSAADKLALKSIADKLPDVGLEEVGNDYKAALWSLIPESEGLPDYSEVEPWLGDSAAFGVVGGADGQEPQVVMSVAVTDQSKAKAFADEHLAEMSTFFVDNLMVVSAPDADVDQASITGSPLSSNATYTADIAKLSGSNLATAWFSADGAALAMQEGEDTTGVTSDETQDLLDGMHGAAGLQVADDTLTLATSVETPNYSSDAGADVRTVAGNLSGDSLFAMAASTTDDSITRAWEAIAGNETISSYAAQFGITSADDLGALIGSSVGVTLAMDDAGSPVVGAALVGDDAARQKEILDSLDTMLQQAGATGLRIEQDGDTGVVAFGQEVADVTSPATKLSTVDGYKKLVDADAQVVAFVNVPAILADQNLSTLVAQSSDVQAWLEPLAGIALTGTQNGTSGEAKLTVAFN